MSKAITDRPDERPLPPPPGPEIAPSVVREDDLYIPRAVGMGGAMLVIFGGMALAFHLSSSSVRLSLSWALLLTTLGVGGLLYHAAFDRDAQFRRLYMALGFALLATAGILVFMPYLRTSGASLAHRAAFPGLGLALLFLIAFLRNETDRQYRDVTQYVIGGAGALLVVLGLFIGNLRSEFFVPTGLLMALFGFFYVMAFVLSRGISDDLAYYGAMGLGAAGALVILVAVIRSLTPGALAGGYFKAFGFLLTLTGLLYITGSLFLWSDRAIVVMTRRELGAFFYSPIAYLTLFGFAILAWVSYYFFLEVLEIDPRARVEPIVRNYIFEIIPVFAVVFAVPVITMRLLSEEQASGTIEVLLTAPVEDTWVVLSKFLAGLITYLIVWAPFGLLLLAIPVSGGNVFDYRPLLSFLIALTVCGAAFVSMGLFFSSLTRSQIASAVLTFAGMLILTFTHWAGSFAPDTSVWKTVFQHVSYLDFWNNSLTGKLSLRHLLFFLSMTVMFLFLTAQVLGSRKWR